jgi:hypothetical protein
LSVVALHDKKRVMLEARTIHRWVRLLALPAATVASIAVSAPRLGHAATSRLNGYVPSAACHEVKFVGVRGSGDTSSTLGVIATAISGDLATRASAIGVDFKPYGLPYTAVGIDWWKLTNVELIEYRLSEREGRNNLETLIREQARECPGEKLVVEGYSQGAQAVADVFSKGVGDLTPAELSHVKAVVLIADPRFNSRESFDRGSFRVGRNGILGARSPGDLSSVANRVRAWCRRDDIVCQGPGTLATHHQDRYLAEYRSAIVSFVAHQLGWDSISPGQAAVLNVNFSSPLVSISGVPLLRLSPDGRTLLSEPNLVLKLSAVLGPPSDCYLTGGLGYDQWWVTSWSRLGLRVFTNPVYSGPLPEDQPCGGDQRAYFLSADIFVAFPIGSFPAHWTLRTDRGSFVLGSPPTALPPSLRGTGTFSANAGRQDWKWPLGSQCGGLATSPADVALFDYDPVGSTVPPRLNALDVVVGCLSAIESG